MRCIRREPCALSAPKKVAAAITHSSGRERVRRIALISAFAKAWINSRHAFVSSPAFDQIVQHSLHNGSIFGGAFQQAEQVFGPFAIDADCSRQGQLAGGVHAIDLDRQQISCDRPAALRLRASHETR